MEEITAAELRRLRALESRVASTSEALTGVRARRDQFRAEAVTARRELRQTSRDRDRLEKQVSSLVSENAVMADELDGVKRDLAVLGDESTRLRAANEELERKLAAAEKRASSTGQELEKEQKARGRLEKQVANLTDKLEGNEPPELTPDHLSHLVGRFIDSVGAQTGMRVDGTRLQLKVGFSGRGGGSFVVPTADMDPKELPGLHDIELDLSPAGLADLVEPRPDG